MSSVREYVSKVTDRQRKIAQLTLREEIAAGIVDIGPATKHTPVTEDIRDMRDPALLADRLDELTFAARDHYKDDNLPMSKVYEYAASRGLLTVVPGYDPGESTVTLTQREYREELEARAAAGDKFAISMLTTGKPGDSDD